jgi:fatty-acyl-CoA synthase
MLTVGEVRDETSRYVQALASLGVGRETRVALLSANRPEVLHVSHAVQILAGIIAPLHPLGSAADHLYQIQDAGIEILVFEGERYSERADALARGAPGLRLASLGPSPIADDLGSWPPACRLSRSWLRAWKVPTSCGSAIPEGPRESPRA